MDTSDTSWMRCGEDWERLRWARARAGYTQDQFAKRVGMNRTAYVKYEAEPGRSTVKHTPLKYEQARPWAKHLKVRWEWLLENDGSPFDDAAPADKVRQALSGIFSEEEIEQVAGMADFLDRRRTGTGG